MRLMLAHAALALFVVVRVYDTVGVPADTAAAARTTASKILKQANIDVRWVECPGAKPAEPVELMVRLSASTPASEPASLGFSYVDVQKQAGTLATVFADRVHVLAEAARADEGELLGRAMAHEIGHLLLGTHDHAVTGLMRGKWTSIELEKNRPVDWMLTRGDGASMRKALNRRILGARDAPLIAAAR